MASRSRTISIDVVADTAQATKSLKNIEGTVTKTGKTFSNMGKVLAGAVAGRAVIGAVGDAIEQAEAMSSAYAATEQIIKSTGGVAGITAEHIKELSKAQAINTGVAKDMVTEGNNILLTFKNISNQTGEGNDIFDRTSAIMLDMAAVMKTDAKSGAVQLGKALNDPVKGLTALTRVGVTFTEEQKRMIRTMVEAGDTAGAQRIILQELESEFGGVAAATADATDKMAVARAEMLETVGTALLPFVAAAARVSLELTGTITELDGLAMSTGQAKDSLGFLAGRIVKLSQDLVHWNLPWTDFRKELNLILDEIAASPQTLNGLKDNLGNLAAQWGLTTDQVVILREEIDKRLNKTISTTADQVLRGKLIPALEDTQSGFGETEGAAQGYREELERILGIKLPVIHTGRFGYTTAPGYQTGGPFHEGGTIPGLPGENVPVMAQAGETITRRSEVQTNGASILQNVYVTNPSPTLISELVERQRRE